MAIASASTTTPPAGVNRRSGGLAVDVGRAARLFRTHIGGRAHHASRLGALASASRLDRARDPKIGHDRMAFLKQDVLRLDVAMYDAAPVRGRQSVRHFPSDPDRLPNGQLVLALQQVA